MKICGLKRLEDATGVHLMLWRGAVVRQAEQEAADHQEAEVEPGDWVRGESTKTKVD